MESYRLFVDESGDHVFRDPESLKKSPHRFLALIGCMLERGSNYIQFSERLEALKRGHFKKEVDDPHETIILHREDIIKKSGEYWQLRNDEKRNRWDDEFLSFLDDSDFKIMISIVDKLKLQQLYHELAWHPYHLAFTHLLQRYVFELNHINRRGDVMAESRGGTEDELLKKAYRKVYVHGDTAGNSARVYQQALTSKEIKLKKKYKNIAGLQLADLLVNPLKKWILIREDLVSLSPSDFEQRLWQVIEPKWRRSPYNGSIKGFGYIVFPK
jgi:hypothetical protein